MNIYLKWSIVVGFNTIFSFIVAFNFLRTVSGALGVVVGILCFILLYTKLDLFLLKTNRKEWRKALLRAAVTMGVFSLYPAIPMISGSIALDMTSWLLNLSSFSIKQNGFIPIFIATLFTGMILSSGVLLLAGLLRVFFLKKYKLANP